MMNTIDTPHENRPAPLPVAVPQPLESLTPPPPQADAWQEREKGLYWSRLLTGDPATVPAALRQRAGVDDAAQPAEERDYRLVSTINRSWVVDHKGLSREQVRSDWPVLRRSVAQELGVQDDEHELFTALSVQQTEAPQRGKARSTFHRHYQAALQGEDSPAAAEDEAEIASGARELGTRDREELLPLAESLAGAWSLLRGLEQPPAAPWKPDPEYWLRLLEQAPGLWQAVSALAELEPERRAQVYAVARSLPAVKSLESEPLAVLPAMQRSMQRSSADIAHGVVQGAGHIATALTGAAGETLESDSLRSFASAADKHLQALDELRRVAQGEVFPIRLEESSHFAEQLAVDMAGAVPGAALSFAGMGGFGTIALAGAGAAVAEARARAPQGRQELQTAAGIVGGAIQAGIFMGMSRLGAQMLQNSIRAFSRASGGGAKAYALTSLRGLSTLTADTAKMLLAGKAGQAAELGMQELAARVDRVASHIDWVSFGDTFTDIEANMREAAMNLPFVLIAAGRAALHHFRSRDAVLGDGSRLADWGVDATMRDKIMDTPDINTQNALLRSALTGSRRWSAPGSLRDWRLALNLLNTDRQQVFRTDSQVAEFLQLPSYMESAVRPPFKPLDTSRPELLLDVAERATGRRSMPLNPQKIAPFALLWDEWCQHAGGEARRREGEAARRAQYYLSLGAQGELTVPEALRTRHLYHPDREEMVRAAAVDRMNELVSLSYEMLMNLESLDSLRNGYRRVEDARAATEQLRQRIISHLLAAVHRAASGEYSVEEAFAPFIREVEQVYTTRRDRRRHAPLWLRQTDRSAFADMYTKACRKALRSSKRDDPRLLEAYRITLGLRNCAESLIALLPYTDRFQAMLSQGESPAAAMARMLQHEFAPHIDRSVWNPETAAAASAGQGPAHPAGRNARLLSIYTATTGHAPESSPDGKGGLLWRIRRPDGRHTFWYPEQAQAVNELVGNVELMFLPHGRYHLAEQLQLGEYRSRPPEGIYRTHSLPRESDRLTGFELLGAEATDALAARWHGTATEYGLGLELSPTLWHWLRVPGRSLDYAHIKESATPGAYHVLQERHMRTPLQLAHARFLVYWNRMLTSGWIRPQEVADALVHYGRISREEADRVLALAKPVPVGTSTMPGPERRRFLREHPESTRPGDLVAAGHALARHMADLNLELMLSELPSAGVPLPVQQWFSMAPFSAGLEEGSASGAFRLPLRANPQTSEDIMCLLPGAEEFRRRKQEGGGLPLLGLMRAAYLPAENTRCEQGWCFAVGGLGAFRGASQAYWNLLEDPARARSLLPAREQDALDSLLRPYCGGREPAAALQELSELLRRHPALHAYGFRDPDSGSLARLVLEAPGESGQSAPTYFMETRGRTMRAESVEQGYTLENGASLPPKLQEDARVLPALRLLSVLRRRVADAPYADAQGVCWRGVRYGGAEGRRPGNMRAEDWRAGSGMKAMLSFYRVSAEAAARHGTGGLLEVCGVPLGGISPGDIRPGALRHITVYRNPNHPDQMVRLMPGRPDSPDPRQSVPYVVHSSDGAPLLSSSTARRPEQLPYVLQPLHDFKCMADRDLSYEKTAMVRARHVDRLLEDLLTVRAASPQSWVQADAQGLGNLELLLQLYLDGRVPYALALREPAKLTRGEALVAELGRLCLLAQCGSEPAPHLDRLVEFAARLRDNSTDMKLLRLALRRMASPFPQEYDPAELNPQLLEKTPETDHDERH